jgi:K+-transporting ATPase ATPase C chain
MMGSFLTSLRLTAATLLICSGGYTALILAFAQVAAPHTANGSLITAAEGRVIGSSLIAQAFTQPQYFWPRPSAVGYNAAGAGGSNKSPTSADLTERARGTVAAHGATAERPLPADLAAASGGGLDPHISERAALYQVDRIATARGIAPERLRALVTANAFTIGGFLNDDRLVNVLELNLALDRP